MMHTCNLSFHVLRQKDYSLEVSLNCMVSAPKQNAKLKE